MEDLLQEKSYPCVAISGLKAKSKLLAGLLTTVNFFQDVTTMEASPLYKTTIQNPLVFLSADLRDIAAPDTLQSRILHMQKSTLNGLLKNTYTHQSSDHIQSLKLKPNTVRIQYSSEGPQFLALSQNHHPNWAVYIDGKQSQIQRFNHSLMSVAVPAGKHEVLFVFSSFATVLWWFSLLGFLVLGINLIMSAKRSKVNDSPKHN